MTNRAGRLIIIALLACLAFTTARAAGDTASKEAQAIAAAKQWLVLVDEGKYAESWAAAAEPFREAVTKERWVQQVGGVRTAIGKVATREIKSKTYATSLPGAPDGEYVVIQYETSFAGKKKATETITPMLEKDGRWRISGYFVR